MDECKTLPSGSFVGAEWSHFLMETVHIWWGLPTTFPPYLLYIVK